MSALIGCDDDAAVVVVIPAYAPVSTTEERVKGGRGAAALKAENGKLPLPPPPPAPAPIAVEEVVAVALFGFIALFNITPPGLFIIIFINFACSAGGKCVSS